MKLKLQNVGGIVKPTEIILKEGLNVIRASNATGKTSFTHGLKLVSLDNQQLRNHPEFINDFSDKAIVEVDGEKRIIEKKGLSPMSKTAPLFRINGRQDIIFAMPENEFLNSVIKGEPIDKFLEGFSDAQYYKQLIEKEGVLREVRDELDNEYGNLNTEAKNAQSIRKNLEKEKKELETQQKKKVTIQTKLEEMKSKIKMNKEEEGRLSQLTEDIETFEKTIERTKGTIKSRDGTIKEMEVEQKDCKDAIERFKKEFKNVESTIEDLNKKIEELENILGEDNNDGLYKQREDVEGEIESTEKNVDGGNCLACGRTYTQAQKAQRLKVLNKQKDEIEMKIASFESDFEKYNTKIDYTKKRRNEDFLDNKQRIDVLDSDIREHTKSNNDAEKEIERNKVNLKSKQEALELVKKNVDPKIKKLLDDEEGLKRQVNAILGNISEYEESYEAVEDSEKEVVIIKAKYEFIKRVENLIREELANLKNVVKNDFNKKIMPIYNKLGFKDFKNIEIDSTFRIKVNRKGKEQELNRLSTSERVTLGVVVMLAGKEEYLPDYPFFVLDEITTAYDPARFKKIIEYLANETKTQYTIVTAFSPTGDTIKVEHKL